MPLSPEQLERLEEILFEDVKSWPAPEGDPLPRMQVRLLHKTALLHKIDHGVGQRAGWEPSGESELQLHLRTKIERGVAVNWAAYLSGVFAALGEKVGPDTFAADQERGKARGQMAFAPTEYAKEEKE